VNNRLKNVKPWTGPLPPPQTSPLQTLGDALAKAKVVNRRKSDSRNDILNRHQRLGLSEKSSGRAKLLQTPTSNSAKTSPRVDQMSRLRVPESVVTATAGRASSPVAIMADSNAEKGQAQSTVFSNSKSGLPGVIKDGLIVGFFPRRSPPGGYSARVKV
jgi:hypothetical protein